MCSAVGCSSVARTAPAVDTSAARDKLEGVEAERKAREASAVAAEKERSVEEAAAALRAALDDETTSRSRLKNLIKKAEVRARAVGAFCRRTPPRQPHHHDPSSGPSAVVGAPPHTRPRRSPHHDPSPSLPAALSPMSSSQPTATAATTTVVRPIALIAAYGAQLTLSSLRLFAVASF